MFDNNIYNILTETQNNNMKKFVPIKEQEKKCIEKKVFAIHKTNRNLKPELPAYYCKRMGKSEYEIPQNEFDWIRKVGGLEKSENIDHMFKGLMNYAIKYRDDVLFMKENSYFQKKLSDISTNLNLLSSINLTQKKEQEDKVCNMFDDLLELIEIQTTAILFHRLLKSDSVDIIKNILKQVPIYRSVTEKPTGNKDTLVSYQRIRLKFLRNIKLSSNYMEYQKNQCDLHKSSTLCDKAKNEVSITINKWLKYILQSVWNGNNPIHDCLYYGSYQSLAYLITYYCDNNMKLELKNMMLEKNGQDESYLDLINSGRQKCVNTTTYYIRNKQYNDCEQLFMKTLDNLLQNEPTKHISNPTKDDTKNRSSLNENDEQQNIYQLIVLGDILGMIQHIKDNKNDNEIIKKTMTVWESIVKSDDTGMYDDYLTDVKNDNDIMEILNKIAK